MARLAFFANFLLFAGAVVLAGCGSSHQLKSVAVTPATAGAKNSADGKVEFTAAGTFSSPPSPQMLTTPQVMWCYGGVANAANPVAGTCAGNIAQFATVDQNGVAQCAPGFQGTVAILAGTQPSMGNPDGGTQLKVYGSAELTCP